MEHKYVNNASMKMSSEVFPILEKIEQDGGFNAANVRKYPVTASPVSLEMVDHIVSLVRLKKTNECYNTNESVNDDDILVDISQRIGWNIKPWYLKLVTKIVTKMNCLKQLSTILSLEQSFRLKRCKGSSWVYFTSTLPPQQAMVFDITYRTDITCNVEREVPVFFLPQHLLT